jgi:hypothetical protein
VILLCETPILWKSQSQRTVSLSSTKAEYYATAEAAKEIKFVTQVLESLNLKVDKPIIVHIDNVGAIFVAENASATKNTRHIDACYHFVHEYIIDGHIKILFVMSKDNMADIFTKNVNSEIYEEHIDKFLIHCEVIQITSTELNSNQFFDSGGVSEMNCDSESSKLNMAKRNQNGTSSGTKDIDEYLLGKYIPHNKSVKRIYK